MPDHAVLHAEMDAVLAEAAAIDAEWARVDRPSPLPHRLIAKAIALPTAAFALLVASAALAAMIGEPGSMVGYLLLLAAVAFGLEVPTVGAESAAWLAKRVRSLDASLLPEERAEWREAIALPFAPGILLGTTFGLPIASLLRGIDALALLLLPAAILAGARIEGIGGGLLIVIPALLAVGRIQRVARAAVLRVLTPRAALLLVVRQVSIISLRERAARAQARLRAVEAEIGTERAA